MLETATPHTKKGKTSQFGMRRLRTSVNVATLKTITVGHQANECINPAPFPVAFKDRAHYAAILQPNFQLQISCDVSQITVSCRSGCTRLFTAIPPLGMDRIHTFPCSKTKPRQTCQCRQTCEQGKGNGPLP